MTAITLHLTKKHDIQIVEYLAKSLNVPFEKKKEQPYDANFVARVLESREQEKEGKTKKIAVEDLWK
jgi:hypothetical protein